MSIVIKKIRFTQPQWLPNQIQNTFDHYVECDDANPYPNGMPVPTQDNPYDWTGIFEDFDNLPEYTDITP